MKAKQYMSYALHFKTLIFLKIICVSVVLTKLQLQVKLHAVVEIKLNNY